MPTTAATSDCTAAAIENPKYPPLALQARISGLVVARFHVDAAGSPQGIQLEGDRFLTPALDTLIRRTTFPKECHGRDLDVTFRFRLDEAAPATPSVAFNTPNEYVITAGPQPILCVLRSHSQFKDYPASPPFQGAFALPKSGKIVDSSLRKTIGEAARRGPNFAGHYALVKFQIGDGPIGALVVDAKSGKVFRLPQQVTREDFLIHDTGCLDRFAALSLPGEASPLSFELESELLIVSRCIPAGVERSYFRWRRNQWTLLQRVTSPPPPPPPVH